MPNISRNKDNHTIKIGQLIEYNTRNNLLEKSFAKFAGETTFRPFSKISKLTIYLNQ